MMPENPAVRVWYSSAIFVMRSETSRTSSGGRSL